MDGFNAHILSDDASAGSVVVGTGISATLLLFFQQSFERMLPYLVIEAVVEAKTGANIEGAITIKKTDESENKEEVKYGKED